jgi:hypothetical protein
MKMAAFWVVAPCRLVRVYRRFRGMYCLHHQGRRQPSSGSYCYFPEMNVVLQSKLSVNEMPVIEILWRAASGCVCVCVCVRVT